MKTISMKCASCGAGLQIASDMDSFACGYCGEALSVARQGGTVVLQLVADVISKVQVGTDRTAAELALVRLPKEISELESTILDLQNKIAYLNAEIYKTTIPPTRTSTGSKPGSFDAGQFMEAVGLTLKKFNTWENWGARLLLWILGSVIYAILFKDHSFVGGFISVFIFSVLILAYIEYNGGALALAREIAVQKYQDIVNANQCEVNIYDSRCRNKDSNVEEIKCIRQEIETQTKCLKRLQTQFDAARATVDR